MESTTQQDPAEQLIELIANAVTLTDEQKTLYLAQLAEGRIHPELLQGLDALCERETAAAQEEIDELEADIAMQEELTKREESELLRAAQPLLQEHEKETREIVSTYKQNCSAIERGLDKDIEG